MNGKEILVDTNILVFLLSGDDKLENLFTDKDIYISFITELELLAYPPTNSAYDAKIKIVLASCIIVPLDNGIKNEYVKIRRQTKLKLADSIIAATALALKLPLITADKALKTVNKLQLLFYEKN